MDTLDRLARLALLALLLGIFAWTTRALFTGRVMRAGCWVMTFFAVWMALLGGVVLIAPRIQPANGAILAAAGIALAVQVGLWSERWGVMPRLARAIETWPARWAGYPPPKSKRKRTPKRKIGGV